MERVTDMTDESETENVLSHVDSLTLTRVLERAEAEAEDEKVREAFEFYRKSAEERSSSSKRADSAHKVTVYEPRVKSAATKRVRARR
jgi:hypothetical protein